jgi:hypothetical protein
MTPRTGVGRERRQLVLGVASAGAIVPLPAILVLLAVLIFTYFFVVARDIGFTSPGVGPLLTGTTCGGAIMRRGMITSFCVAITFIGPSG